MNVLLSNLTNSQLIANIVAQHNFIERLRDMDNFDQEADDLITDAERYILELSSYLKSEPVGLTGEH